jgi:hypothetical protein
MATITDIRIAPHRLSGVAGASHSVAGPMTVENFVERLTRHIPHHVQFIEEKRKFLN